jgi:hypothetical protein
MDAKVAGLLSQLAYRDTDAELNAGLSQYADRLQGWTVFPDAADISRRDGYPADGTQGAFTIFINTTTKELAFAFKGTNTVGEFVDDIFNSGRSLTGRSSSSRASSSTPAASAIFLRPACRSPRRSISARAPCSSTSYRR